MSINQNKYENHTLFNVHNEICLKNKEIVYANFLCDILINTIVGELNGHD